jgi:hypothetical protein
LLPRLNGFSLEDAVQQRSAQRRRQLCSRARAGKPATKTQLLHLEDFNIPENLSRFAVKQGMWGFIKTMTPHMHDFIAARRARGVQPNEPDPHAFGAPDADGVSRTGSSIKRGFSEQTLSSTSTSPGSRTRLRKVASAVAAGGIMLACLTAPTNGSNGSLARSSQKLSDASDEDDEPAR